VAAYGIPILWVMEPTELANTSLFDDVQKDQYITYLLKTVSTIPHIRPLFALTLLRAAAINDDLYRWLSCDPYDHPIEDSMFKETITYRPSEATWAIANYSQNARIEQRIVWVYWYLFNGSRASGGERIITRWQLLFHWKSLCLVNRYFYDNISDGINDYAWNNETASCFGFTASLKSGDETCPQGIFVSHRIADFNGFGHGIPYNAYNGVKIPIGSTTRNMFHFKECLSEYYLARNMFHFRECLSEYNLDIMLNHLLLKTSNVFARQFLFITSNESQFDFADENFFSNCCPMDTVCVWTHLHNPKSSPVFSFKDGLTWYHTTGSVTTLYANAWLKPQILKNTRYRGYVNEGLSNI
jgi:hypothetical protein